MSHIIHDKQNILTRTNKIEGQIVALKKMIDEPRECTEILQQIAAIQGAANGLFCEVIKGHLTEHLVNEKEHSKREEDLGVVLKILDSYIK
ncbi:Ni(II)/Co(II)-binding transcriptional repressor RcnR [Morganella morganii]|uniref:Ni(II)/Co(II)-binding transcriptional repressor RcnR n=1 Tax=Morganella morganii TaxID=582 RepID=UPI001A2B73F2|nr:Ni(II)/Co(II)-binding transcriptional repressor RcnR [Vibrio vulnificus]